MVGSFGRRDALTLLVLILVAVGVPLSFAVAANSIGIPTLDDWVYTQGATSFFRTGTVDLPGHTAGALGQIVLVQPLLWLSAGDPWAFTAFGLIAAAIGLIATYALARRFVGTGPSTIVALSVEAMPGFVRESSSFMTDGPGYTLIVLSLLCGVLWIETGRPSRLVLCILFGILGVSVREFAVAAPVAVLVVGWAQHRHRRAWVIAGTVAVALGLTGVLLLADAVPGRGLPQTSWGPERLILLLPAFVTVGAVLLPTLTLAIGRVLPNLASMDILVATVLVGLSFLQPWGEWTGGGGNIWTPTGLYGDGLLRGVRDTLFGGRAWALSTELAFVGAVLLAILIVRWWRRSMGKLRSLGSTQRLSAAFGASPDAVLKTFAVLYALELVGVAVEYSIWDRYLYPLIPAVAILIVRMAGPKLSPGRGLAISHGALAWLALSAFAITSNSFAYDAARWHAGSAAVALGYDARTVDAGYEWIGYHASGPGQLKDARFGQAWFEGLIWPNPICAVVLNSPGDATNLLDDSAVSLTGVALPLRVNVAAYRQYLFFGPTESLYLFAIEDRRCPTAPSPTPPKAGW